MHIYLDHHSGEPIYRQIVEAVKYKVAAGQLVAGDQLPSIRSLSSQLNINPGTVVKAYGELCHIGLIVMRQGQGVFIAPQRAVSPAALRRKVLSAMARRLLSEARRLGATPEEVFSIVQAEAIEMETLGEAEDEPPLAATGTGP